MKFNREKWKNWEHRKPCPFCHDGLLLPQDGMYLQEETKNSKDNHAIGNHQTDEFYFTGFLKCSNCKESAIISGVRTQLNFQDEDGEYRNYYDSISIFPPPRIIQLPKTCPKEVKESLESSFALFWVENESCANKIRTSIEMLLDNLGVPRERLSNNGKTIHLSLGKRIEEEVNNIHPEISAPMKAIKWIGNAGSHGSSLTIDDVLDAYEILEQVLLTLYDKSKEELKEKIDKINNTCSPISKH